MHPSTASARSNLAACIVMIAVTAVAIIARFAVHLHRGSKPSGSDWLCLAAIPSFYAYCASIIWFIYRGSDAGAFDLDLNLGLLEIRNLLKAIYFAEIMFGVVITTTKLSILWFYYSIFATGTRRGNKWAIIAVAIVCAVWFLITEPMVVMQCHPIHDLWDTFGLSSTCFNPTTGLLGYELTNFFIDVTILCLPAPMVWKLKLGKSRKVAVISIFLLGSLVCIASIMRLVYIWHQPGGVPNFAKNMVWSTIQLGLAILCACLPTLNPILAVVAKPFAMLKTWTSSLISTSRSKNNSSNSYSHHQNEGTYGVYNGGGHPDIFHTNSSKIRANSKESSDDFSEDTYPIQGIKVHRRVEVVEAV